MTYSFGPNTRIKIAEFYNLLEDEKDINRQELISVRFKTFIEDKIDQCKYRETCNTLSKLYLEPISELVLKIQRAVKDLNESYKNRRNAGKAISNKLKYTKDESRNIIDSVINVVKHAVLELVDFIKQMI